MLDAWLLIHQTNCSRLDIMWRVRPSPADVAFVSFAVRHWQALRASVIYIRGFPNVPYESDASDVPRGSRGGPPRMTGPPLRALCGELL